MTRPEAAESMGATGSTGSPGASVAERPLVFDCNGDRMVGVLAIPGAAAETGVVIVVGGPQYRAGSHRQFVLLSRALAQAGFVVLRYDYRGKGDSEGTVRTFEEVSADVAAAITAMRSACSTVEEIVLWGLCDGASAALMYVDAHREAARTRSGGAVSGLVLVNPWVRSEVTFARTQIRHYYLRRLAEPAFWSKLLRGRIRLGASVGDLGRAARSAAATSRGAASQHGTFQQRMLDGLAKFAGPVLLLMSGRDLTAREFDEYAAADRRWRESLHRSSVRRVDIPTADHTFSGIESRLEAERATIDWLRQRFGADPR